ncbi:hypothetical protein EB796_005166 [Bugula neritina]|uniref:Pericentriolar material 1 protein C-terminal domain-containing protein n=1 Tax=Bugula neritina TaxID=10212 RepID=A0A7J7KE08_BUGNE|nr:hypothetical protein EB796_005166 [Bugula neritina]
MQKVKDIDKLKEAKRQAKVDSSSVNDSAESSSSAHDADASDAVSDIDDSTDASNSIRCIDAEVLDRRIKVIMADIIPVLREHMENLCSSQLLDISRIE